MASMIVSRGKLADFAKEFIKKLPHEAGAGAYVAGLSGELGAGKTTFVQHVARELGVIGTVPSPTFVIAQSYDIDHPPFTKLIHIDAYRLAPNDADTFGWGHYLSRPGSLVLVEWPEHIPGGLPRASRRLEFKVAGHEEREIVEL
jgi:tRNA threonylcarbamoyladenosine biosynthesis protein TsaE